MSGSNFVLYDTAKSILDYVYGQLECTVFGRPCSKTVTLCELSNPCCDSLSVWVDGLPALAHEDCNSFTDSMPVEFRVKLVRPCRTESTCDPTVENDTMIRSLYVDQLVLHSALRRFAEGFQHCQSSWAVTPVTYECNDSMEMCSVMYAGVVLDLGVCDEGACQFTTDIEVVPSRCKCEPDEKTSVAGKLSNPEKVMSANNIGDLYQ